MDQNQQKLNDRVAVAFPGEIYLHQDPDGSWSIYRNCEPVREDTWMNREPFATFPQPDAQEKAQLVFDALQALKPQAAAPAAGSDSSNG